MKKQLHSTCLILMLACNLPEHFAFGFEVCLVGFLQKRREAEVSVRNWTQSSTRAFKFLRMKCAMQC